jgi:hypothetical protein
MRGFHSSSFDPQTLIVLEAAFDEAWLTLKAIGNSTVRPDELARSVLQLAMEGERDPVALHDGALRGCSRPRPGAKRDNGDPFSGMRSHHRESRDDCRGHCAGDDCQ